MPGSQPCHDVTFHIGRHSVAFLMERLLFRRMRYRLINTCDSDEFRSTYRLPYARSPGRVGAIAIAIMHDVTADQAGARGFVQCETAGNPETDDCLATLRNRLLDELLEPHRVTASGYTSDTVGSRGDASLGTEARGGDDETRHLPLGAHIPTRKDFALAALR
jgi:hypothetical protein